MSIITIIWLLGWIGSTIYAAAAIGYLPNYPGEKNPSFPAFVVPLLFGWSWPVVLVIFIVVAPLVWLSNRTRDRK